jgi:hypothetical protein
MLSVPKDTVTFQPTRNRTRPPKAHCGNGLLHACSAGGSKERVGNWSSRSPSVETRKPVDIPVRWTAYIAFVNRAKVFREDPYVNLFDFTS